MEWARFSGDPLVAISDEADEPFQHWAMGGFQDIHEIRGHQGHQGRKRCPDMQDSLRGDERMYINLRLGPPCRPDLQRRPELVWPSA